MAGRAFPQVFLKMKKKCPQCKLVNYPTAIICVRCGSPVLWIDGKNAEDPRPEHKILRRVSICIIVCVAALAGFYISLVFSADPLDREQRMIVRSAIEVLEDKGFTSEARLLRRLAVFRSTDNWLNASVVKENAFAATNFPFGIVTLYPDFFYFPADDVERAAILLHEARHLAGDDEKAAYEYVWRNRNRLGWSRENYSASMVWNEIRKQTREVVPNLFVCDVNVFNDCTESPDR